MQSDFEFERCGGCGGCGVPKSAREQQVNNTFTGVCSRRLRGQTNLESDKHAGKPGAFATLHRGGRDRELGNRSLAQQVVWFVQALQMAVLDGKVVSALYSQ